MGRYPVFMIRRLKTDKMTIPSKLIYRLKAIYIKILPAFFFFLLAEVDKPILKFIWKFKRPQIAQTILKKKNKAG